MDKKREQKKKRERETERVRFMCETYVASKLAEEHRAF